MVRFNTNLFYYKPKFVYLTILAVAFIILLSRCFFYLDPDFGWHYRMGEIILAGGLPKTDPLSYTMPSFPLVDHEWLNDVFFAKAYDLWGLGFLTILFALLPTASVALTAPKRINLNYLLFSALVLTIIIQFSGIKDQVETWFFICLLLRVLFSQKLWQKAKFTLPAMFVLWANLHGEFSLGLGVFFVFSVFKSVEQRSINSSLVTVFLLSLAATLINPYEARLWWVALTHLTDQTLRAHIYEWMPITVQFAPQVRFAFLIYFYLWIILALKYRKGFSSSELGVFTFLLIAAIASRRHIPLWALSTLFLAPKLNFDIRNIRLKLALIAAVLIISLLQLRVIQNDTLNNSEQFNYPYDALPFIRSHIVGEVFSDYGWGGYLNWKLPQKKVFINGMMPTWSWTAPKGEASSALSAYNAVISGSCSFTPLFDKYNIQTVVWPTHNLAHLALTNVVLGQGATPEDSFIKCLQKLKWREIYSDYVTVVYTRATLPKKDNS